MINIVKEIKIDILKGVKFLMRVYKRDAMFSFSLAIFIVSAFSIYYSHKVAGFRLIVLECSATVCLTCIFLYIFDLINGIKNYFKQRGSKEKVQECCTRVTVGIPKK